MQSENFLSQLTSTERFKALRQYEQPPKSDRPFSDAALHEQAALASSSSCK